VKVLIAGVNGQLGRALLASRPAGVDLVALDRAELDLADAAAVDRRVRGERAQVLINAAAYTAVDAAESARELAFAVNAGAPAAMARACRDAGTRFVHVSTDFVFDGTRGSPRAPGDETAPLNVYGQSKLAGEREIAAVSGLDWLIVRTAWVYSPHGRNFLLTMLRLMRERGAVRVVADQIGTPTSAQSLAQCLWLAAADGGPPAVLHFTDAGVASWYDFAVAIAEEARAQGVLDADVAVTPIASAEFPTPARRPNFSVLDSRATYTRLALQPTHWRAALRATLKEIKA
jgi:dTDP-4-dehydrorhamnose reductase